MCHNLKKVEYTIIIPLRVILPQRIGEKKKEFESKVGIFLREKNVNKLKIWLKHHLEKILIVWKVLQCIKRSILIPKSHFKMNKDFEKYAYSLSCC